MRKVKLLVLIAFALTFCFSLSLVVACEKHVFDQEVAKKEFLATPATCTQKATYYYSCECGEKGTETFEYGRVTPHTYNQEVVKDEFIASEATCSQKATYFKSCVCGEKGTKTFVYGNILEHVKAQDWSKDGTHHWKTCEIEGCQERFDEAEHSVTDGETCETCRCEVYMEGLQFTLNNDGQSYCVKGIDNKTAKIVKIPSIYENKPVTSIRDNAFYDFTDITSITIPDSILSIGSLAFYNCTSLTSVTIPDSVTRIGQGAFENCSSLQSITLPFVGATKEGLENVSFGYIFGAEKREDNGRAVPESLKTVVVTSATSIGYEAFYWCAKITSITIPDSVTIIESYAFNECIAEIVWGDEPTITQISGMAFYEYLGTSITIPDSVENIGSHAFYDSRKIMSITIGENVESIAENAFENCYKLAEVYNKSSLEIVVGRSDPGLLGVYARNVYTPTEGESKLSTDNNGFSFCVDGNNTILIGYEGSQTSLLLPSNITEINHYAFCNSSLESITIPESVTVIGDSAFSSCSNLTSVTIPDSVTYIGKEAFFSCSKLVSVQIPNSVTSIEDWTFRLCSKLETVVIPESVKDIGEFAFAGVVRLKTIYYGGSAENWSEIAVANDNESLTSATIYYYSESEPTESGNYWHYVDGVATIWNSEEE